MGRYLGSPEPRNDLGVTTVSHGTNLTQERFVGREIPRRVAASAKVRSRRELGRT